MVSKKIFTKTKRPAKETSAAVCCCTATCRVSDGEPKRRQNMPKETCTTSKRRQNMAKETCTTSKRPAHEIFSAFGCCSATFSRKMKNLKHCKRDLYQFKKRRERDAQKRPSLHCVGALPLEAIKRRVQRRQNRPTTIRKEPKKRPIKKPQERDP